MSEETQEKPVEFGVAKFTVTEQEIAVLSQYKDLVIAGVEDREGYKKVHDARMEVRNKRIEIQKDEEKLKGKAREYIKTVGGLAKHLYDQLEPIEDNLSQKEAFIDDEKERIKQDRLKAEQLRIQGRVKRLIDAGMSFDGEYYTISMSPLAEGIGDGVCLGSLDIKAYDDDQFELALSEAEQIKLFLEEKQRLEAQQAEAERLEQERKAAELKAQEEARIAEERRILEEQRRELEARRIKLEEDELYAQIQAKFKQEQIDAENARIAKEQAGRQAELDRQQKEIDDARAEAKRITDAAIAEQKRLKDIADAKESARLAEVQRKEKEDSDKLAAKKEAEEKAAKDLALLPDKQKLQDYAARLIELPMPQLEREDAKAICNDTYKKVKEASNYILNRLKTL